MRWRETRMQTSFWLENLYSFFHVYVGELIKYAITEKKTRPFLFGFWASKLILLDDKKIFFPFFVQSFHIGRVFLKSFFVPHGSTDYDGWTDRRGWCAHAPRELPIFFFLVSSKPFFFFFFMVLERVDGVGLQEAVTGRRRMERRTRSIGSEDT